MTNILIAEDEILLMLALKDNLEAEGYRISAAVNGEEAIEKINQDIPDIMLLDLLMPKKDGFCVLEEIKKKSEWKNIPVIVLSNLGGDDEIKRALALGATDYFVKSQHPVTDVILKIKEIIKK